ncbi:MAG: hypothetical protein JOZ38_11515 [Candidatus Eremiobacteraeota bacterium]|nr:hypothetical protein [Candidatus Eremiobacteraeota bacterium]
MKRFYPVLFPALIAAIAGPASAQNAVPQSVQSAPRAAHRGLPARFRNLNLSDQQRQQISQLLSQYRQTHPRGSTPDPQGRRALRAQIRNLLTPDQQAQLKASVAQTARRGGGMHMLQQLNLSDQQRSQIRQLMQTYRQSHPAGSPPDPQARQQLREQIRSILTPEQQQELQQLRQQRRQTPQGQPQQQEAPAPQPPPQPESSAQPDNA